MKWIGKKEKRVLLPKQRVHVQFDGDVVGTGVFGQWRGGNQREVKALLCPRFAAESLQSVGHLPRFLFR